MCTDIPTNGELAGMFILLMVTLVGLLICVNYQGTSRVDDIASWTRNYQKLQRRR